MRLPQNNPNPDPNWKEGTKQTRAPQTSYRPPTEAWDKDRNPKGVEQVGRDESKVENMNFYDSNRDQVGSKNVPDAADKARKLNQFEVPRGGK